MLYITGSVIGSETFSSKAGRSFLKLFLDTHSGGRPMEVVVDPFPVQLGAKVRVACNPSGALFGKLVEDQK